MVIQMLTFSYKPDEKDFSFESYGACRNKNVRRVETDFFSDPMNPTYRLNLFKEFGVEDPDVTRSFRYARKFYEGLKQ